MRRPVSKSSEIYLASQTWKYVLHAINPVTPTPLVIIEHKSHRQHKNNEHDLDSTELYLQ